MQGSSNKIHKPDCPLAHDLINKSSAIVGHCDLLLEEMPEDSPFRKRMFLVQQLARSMAADIVQFQCDLTRRRTVNSDKTSIF